MRIDGCDRRAAMRQIEAAVRDGALHWVMRGSDRWDWDAEVFRADLLKLWPPKPGKQDCSEKTRRAGCIGSGSVDNTVRDDLKEARDWHTEPLPDAAELHRLTELKNSIRQEIQLHEQDRLAADLLEEKFHQAADDIQGTALAWLAQGQLAAYRNTAGIGTAA